MSIAILILGALGLAFSIYAICKPHWPNGCALGAMWEASKLLGCRHTAQQWRIVRRLDGRLDMRCMACERGSGPAPQITRPA